MSNPLRIRSVTTAACSVVAAGLLVLSPTVRAADEVPFRETQQTALADVDRRLDELRDVNHAIWEYAELGLEEHRSAALLVSKLKDNGFKVREGVSQMPTAFVGEFGSGRPIIGILAEYDALPGMSQKAEPDRSPVVEGAPGHACGHSGLGTGALGAALAVKAAMEKHNIPGTLRLYGTPAEETVIGKIYMLLDGQFDDLDVCLHWHPSTKTGVWAGSSKAVVSVRFTFDGVSAHAAGNPEKGRSALDAVELMNIGVNFMREHVKEDARIHYVITDGGGAPNVVPPTASVWYFVRADKHEDVEAYFKWVNDIAKGAALMTRTTLRVSIDTDCHELISNDPLSEILHTNLQRVGPPEFSADEQAFARRIQQPLIDEFGLTFPQAIAAEIEPLTESYKPSKGSTDVGDISWYVPTGGIRTTCMAAESPGHSWQNVACIGSSIGDKGVAYASRVLAVSALDLFENPALVSAAKADWKSRMSDRKYTSLIPEGQAPPRKIR